MVKVYLDWNVMSQMKGGKHSELQQIFKTREIFILPFSTSHIGDIFSSYKDEDNQKVIIDEDLSFISKLTKDYCLYNQKGQIIIQKYPPKELFQQRVAEKDLFKDISIDGLMNIFNQDKEIGQIIKPIFELLNELPLEKDFLKALNNPETSKQLDHQFPGLKENPTMDSFFKSFNEMFKELNEGEGYKELRQQMQAGFHHKRDKIFNSDNPYKLISENHNKLGFNIENSRNENEYAPKWFNNISNEYIMLDMQGYQEDKVEIKKGRKQTFKNTSEDAFHAAFASTCNIYVINDKRAYNKTKKVFEKLKINTQVYNPLEFLNYYNKFLTNENLNVDMMILKELLSSKNYIVSNSDKANFRTNYLPYFLFGFFNKFEIIIPNDKKEELIIYLSQDKPSNWFILPIEVENLVDKLLAFFGDDIFKLGKLKPGEFNSEKWDGRRWRYEDITFRLIANNGYVHFYLDFDIKKKNLFRRLVDKIKNSKKT